MIELSDEQRSARLDGIELQKAKWRMGDRDGALAEKARRIIQDIKGRPFIMQTLEIENTIYSGYLHSAAQQFGYEFFKLKGIGSESLFQYEIPPIALATCRSILKKFENR